MGLLGKVVLKTGNFVLPNEEVQDHEQQPQFLPRVYWPGEREARRSQIQTALNVNIVWDDPAAVEELSRNALEIYPSLIPMMPYGTERPMSVYSEDVKYDGCQWPAHLAVAHNLFHKTLNYGKNLNIMEMMVLVRMVTYGIFNSTTFFPPFTVGNADSMPGSGLNFGALGQATWPRMHREPGDLTHSSRDECIKWSKQRLWTKRWVILPMMYPGLQWGMTIFDRLKGQLFIFDCGDEESKDRRVESAIKVWVEFLHDLGQPYTFLYFVPPVTKQLYTRHSGLLCVTWLMEVLRNQVGKPMTSRDDNVRKKKVTARNYHGAGSETEREHVYISSLPLRDWAPMNCTNANAKMMAVRRILRVMLANELGLRNHVVMTQIYKERGGPEAADLPSAWRFLTENARELHNNQGLVRKKDFFTGHGGPQYALPMRKSILRYDNEAPRRHPMHKLPGKYHQIRIQLEHFRVGAQIPFDWPDDRSNLSAGWPAYNATPVLDFSEDSVPDHARPQGRGSANSHLEPPTTQNVPEMRQTRSRTRLRRGLAAQSR
ncbi:hypothetical protein ED733_003228 [Metarhizium rileyi]|uniref:Uncharacterized protein n=1 Tax=Metarhizium rileyi (strain RCEF 4871) TaxID=1649241 RepID=A0A5C6G364_METRR|nr:hypothetical protein ED733_003228 [Metarhizium rileyi]